MLCENKIDLYKYFGLTRLEGGAGYLNSYILDNYPEHAGNRLRPAMLVFPGGGYWCRSQREEEVVALSYVSQGFQAFTVEYSVTRECPEAKHPIMLIEAAMAVAYVRIHADKYNIDTNKIGVLGFSAGGHLAGSILTAFEDDAIKTALKENSHYCRPDFGVLCYPVITLGKETHQGTSDHVTGKDPDIIERLSLQNRVTENTPPTFIWTTAEDKAVPPVNSLLMAMSLSRNNVPFELHVYQKGVHGMSLAIEETASKTQPYFIVKENQEWFIKSVEFLKRNGFVREDK
jgi:acetyl esterase/lipase